MLPTGRALPPTPGLQRWGLRLTAAGVLSSLLLNAAVPDGRAEVFRPYAVAGASATAIGKASPVAKKKRPNAKPAETYSERQDRIAKSPRSMLAPSAGNEGADTTCVSGEFTTLSVVYDSILDALLPSLPPPLLAAAEKNRRDIQAWMRNVHVSTLAVSDHPNSLGADQDDPQYRTALSQLVVNNLLKIRDGRQDEAIPVANITLSQAVESVWLYVFAGILAPAGFAIQLMPSVNALGVIPLHMLLQIGFTGSRLGLQYLYQGTSSAILNQCVARVTDEQKEQAGKPSETVKYDIPIHPLIQGAANQLALADNDTCPPIGDLPLGRIVERTAEYAKATAPNDAARRQIDTAARGLLRQMKATAVPHNLIPADPADFSSGETMLSMAGPAVLSAVPQLGGLIGGQLGVDLSFLDFLKYIGGAPLDIAIGLGHNIGQGDNLTEMVSVHDLTVTKSLTAAYYAYYTALYLFTTVGSELVEPITPTIPGGIVTIGISPIKMVGAVLGLPLTYGLVTFHHVMRTMCFVEDDTTGTGLGAEANKRAPEEHAQAVERKRAEDKLQEERTAARRGPAARNRNAQNRNAQNRDGQNRSTRGARQAPARGTTLPRAQAPGSTPPRPGER